MSKRDYQAIARAIHGIRTRPERDESELDVLDVVTGELADIMAAGNPRFDRNRFTYACETGIMGNGKRKVSQ